MGIELPGYSARSAGAVMTVSATASVPALPSMLDLAAGIGLAEGAVGAVLALATAIRIVVGVVLCLRDADGCEFDVPGVPGVPDVPGVRSMPDVIRGTARRRPSPPATTYAPIPTR